MQFKKSDEQNWVISGCSNRLQQFASSLKFEP